MLDVDTVKDIFLREGSDDEIFVDQTPHMLDVVHYFADTGADNFMQSVELHQCCDFFGMRVGLTETQEVAAGVFFVAVDQGLKTCYVSL